MLWEAPPYLVRRNCEQFPRAPECIGLPTREVTIVPMGPRVPEELDGLAAFLEPRFPGLTFRVAPLSNLLEGVLNGSGQVVGERLGPWIPDGSVVVIEKDLKMEGFNFIYSFVERGFIGIVSVSRFRTKLGMPAREGAQLKPGALGLSRKRLQKKMTSTIAKMLRAGPQCPLVDCVLHFEEKGSDLCEAHRAQVRDIIARMPAASSKCGKQSLPEGGSRRTSEWQR